MADSSFDYAVHPLAILNISDQFTRMRVQNTVTASPGLVFGALLGIQSGRRVEIFTSFEVQVHAPQFTVDTELLKTRLEQYKEVFPEYDFLGWYSTSVQSPTAREVHLHKQFMGFNELPVHARLDPSLLGTKALPFYLYESATDSTTGELSLVEVPVKVETSEPERIAVEGVTKEVAAGAGAEGALIQHLSSQSSALAMLHTRIQAILAYVKQVQAGALPPDHDLLRQVASIVHRLPTISSPEFSEALAKEHNDILLAMYLAIMTKTTQATNQMVNKHLQTQSTSGAAGGMLPGHHGGPFGGRGMRGFGGSSSGGGRNARASVMAALHGGATPWS
ncbi:hypothetical protein AMAG_16182 [Allomyces macrogynus ATCC 38327]|uniref:COP9 signalosome complex subunit 6 n=1 Tax=Allomyces macrogynus (strain ATCC 38327) TaxID=578462 RepID=A0A0L0TAQ7_ALLM3|nr:hypothetical protein AMAG_16182 [Allomyces macrogynus ATCC 38327]|eukprot:KNE71624.1 hypothetical protein AMAG_16182 [Allomyces macrogynus ATCC 38327]